MIIRKDVKDLYRFFPQFESIQMIDCSCFEEENWPLCEKLVKLDISGVLNSFPTFVIKCPNLEYVSTYDCVKN